MKRTRLTQVREGIADALDWVALQFWRAAHRLRPVYQGPLCPDCEMAPDLGPDVECPMCVEKHEAQLVARYSQPPLEPYEDELEEAFWKSWDGEELPNEQGA